MVLFFSYISIVLFLISIFLFYNEILYNAERLSKLVDNIASNPADKQKYIDEYNLILKKYKNQYRILSPFAEKLKIKPPEDFM